MRTKRIVTWVLLVFVVASVGYLAVSGTARKEAPPASAEGTREAESGEKVVVYYFHATVRCRTCRTIEAYTEEAVRTGFADRLAEGTMEWRPLNVELPANRHYIDDFQLATRTVVVADVKDGVPRRWVKLDRVWQLVGDKQAFIDYIWDHTNDFLAETHG